MTVAALAPYEFASRDRLENFHGKQLVYVWWEKHRMFSRPFVVALTPATPFRRLFEDYISTYAWHPDWPHIVWDQVIWQNGDEVFTPDFDASLAQNGIGHKDLIRFSTPGLDGIAGTGY
ncbi:MAG: phenol hydroxylase subunit P4 [Ancalomicrobiaceae bacterium]|nr:phenol hydroxylase subunit P4 [Ancalomicrobiaceae bacterium]